MADVRKTPCPKWTVVADAELDRLFIGGMTTAELGIKFKRHEIHIKKRLLKLGLIATIEPGTMKWKGIRIVKEANVVEEPVVAEEFKATELDEEDILEAMLRRRQPMGKFKKYNDYQTVYVLLCEPDDDFISYYYYIGITDQSAEDRFKEHLAKIDAAHWTLLHKPIRILKSYVAKPFDEHRETLEMFRKYGLKYVRGANFCQVILPDYQIDMINYIIFGAFKTCPRCGGSEHLGRKCAEDEAMWMTNMTKELANVRLINARLAKTGEVNSKNIYDLLSTSKAELRLNQTIHHLQRMQQAEAAALTLQQAERALKKEVRACGRKLLQTQQSLEQAHSLAMQTQQDHSLAMQALEQENAKLRALIKELENDCEQDDDLYLCEDSSDEE